MQVHSKYQMRDHEIQLAMYADAFPKKINSSGVNISLCMLTGFLQRNQYFWTDPNEGCSPSTTETTPLVDRCLPGILVRNIEIEISLTYLLSCVQYML
jgi:hypothetical protein